MRIPFSKTAVLTTVFTSTLAFAQTDGSSSTTGTRSGSMSGTQDAGQTSSKTGTSSGRGSMTGTTSASSTGRGSNPSPGGTNASDTSGNTTRPGQAQADQKTKAACKADSSGRPSTDPACVNQDASQGNQNEGKSNGTKREPGR